MDQQQSVSKPFLSQYRRWQLLGAVFVVLCGVLTIVSSIVFAAEEGQGEIPLPPKDGGGGTIQGIGGVGTTNYIPKFTSSTNLGNSVLYELDGNIGIGTTSPYTRLMVSGSSETAALIESFSGGAQLALLSRQAGTGRQFNIASTASGEFQVQDTTAGGIVPFRIFGDAGDSTFVVRGSAVGIGTTLPEQKLTVNGMISALPTTWSQPTGRGVFLYHSGNDGNIYAYDYTQGHGDPIGIAGSTVQMSTYNTDGLFDGPKLTIEGSTGNVGIGTTSPVSALDVRGPTQISEGGALPDTSPYATFGVTRAAVDENYSYLGLTKQGRVPWAFGISNDDRLIIGTAQNGRTIPSPAFSIHPWTSAANLGGSLNLGGNFSITNGLSLQEVRLKHDSDLPNYQGALQFAYDYNNALRLVTWSGDAQILGAAADASKVFFPNGNVGVGTTAPSQKLDVAGYVKGQSGLCIGDDCRTSWPSGGGGGIGGSGSTNYLAKFTGSATIGNSSLVDTGNVGIGTTNPLAKLQVAGSGFFGTASGSLGSSAGPGIRLFYDNGLATPSGTLYAYDYGTNTAKNLILQQPGGNVGIGTVNPAAKLDVAGTTRTTVLTITGGADIAEPFQLVDAERVEPGMVVVIDAAGSGKLRVGTTPYDQRAIGIVSGANGITPGLTLKQTGTAADGTLPVAVGGRVYALADASYGEITPGTMLTTSATKGHVMAASDASRSHGATVGKALTGLIHGRGYVFMLVALQ